jgi:hypothetical protein
MTSAPFKTDISALSPTPVFHRNGSGSPEPNISNTQETQDTSYSREIEFTDLLSSFATTD